MKELNDIAKTSIKGSYFLFLGNTSSLIIMALTAIVVARFLGPENYGLYSITLVVPTFLVSVCDLGISPALTRFSAQSHVDGINKVDNLIKFGLFFKITFTLIISLFLFIFSEQVATHILNRPEIYSLLRIALLYTIGQALLVSINSLFIGLDKAGMSSLLTNIQAIIKAAVSPLLIILGLGVAGALIGTSVGALFASVIGIFILLVNIRTRANTDGEKSNKLKSSEYFGMMISYGAPLYVSSLLLSFQNQFQKILLSLFTSNTNVGNFATAIQFTAVITAVVTPVTLTLFPAFSKLNIDDDKTSLDKLFKLSVKYTSLIIIPASVAIAILSKDIVYTIYGTQYELAPTYLTFYTFNFLLTGIGINVIKILLNSQGETKTTFKINLINLIISLPLAFILIKKHGVLGLIISFITSQLISTSYGLYLINNMYKIKIEWVSSFKILCSSLLSSIPVLIIQKIFPLTHYIYNVLLGSILYLVSYLVFTLILRTLNKEELDKLFEFTRDLPLIHHIADFVYMIEKKIIR